METQSEVRDQTSKLSDIHFYYSLIASEIIKLRFEIRIIITKGKNFTSLNFRDVVEVIKHPHGLPP